MIRSALRRALAPIATRLFPKQWKEHHELRFWKRKRREEGTLSHDHFAYFYTAHFDLDLPFYEGKHVLDIGCGPRGSLEWATTAARRVGLDPLADEYLELGARDHEMEYVASGSERMPFSDASFDVVCSFNSLDHVADLDATVQEIKRVLRPGGLFLLLTDVNHKATACEPQEFSWDVVDAFAPELELVSERRYEKAADGVYQSVERGDRYDESDPTSRYGILSAKLRKRDGSQPVA